MHYLSGCISKPNWLMLATPAILILLITDVDVGVVRLTPLRQPYICSSPNTPMPFSFVNKVVTTLFHNKNKFIRTNIGKLFPKVDAKHQFNMAEVKIYLST